MEYAPRCSGAKDYRDLVAEIEENAAKR